MKPTKAEMEKVAEEYANAFRHWWRHGDRKRSLFQWSAHWILEHFERRAPSKAQLARTRKSFMKTLDECAPKMKDKAKHGK